MSFLFSLTSFSTRPTETSTRTCRLRPTTTTSPQWRIFHTLWIASGVHFFHLFKLPFPSPSLNSFACHVLSGLGGWRRARRWTWSSAAWTTSKPGWPSTKWALDRIELPLTPPRFPVCPEPNPCSDVFIRRPATNWVRPGWSRASVRTPCRDTFSSSSPERRRVSL